METPGLGFRRALEPWTLGPLALRNRVIKSATNEGMARGGVPSRALVQHHRAMAAGSVGLTTVAYCAVTADGRTFPDQVVLDRATRLHLRAVTAAVHAEGGAVSAQLTHGGAFNFLPVISTRYPFSASGGFNPAGALSGRLFKTPMSRADMDAMTAAFVAAAREARECGFDAIELHMGHGYLLSQFLSPLYNKRTDEYGGDARNRARYPVKVLRAVLDAVGNTMPVLCKLSLFDGHPAGGTVDDAVAIAQELSAAGAHLLVLSAGMNVEAPWEIFGNPMPPSAMQGQGSRLMKMAAKILEWRQPKREFRELYLLEAARQVRAAVATPLAYLGGAKSVAGIAQVINEGFDAVVMGRALIHNAKLLQEFGSGAATVSGCTACNECIATMYTPGGTRCVLTGVDDPALNREPASPLPALGITPEMLDRRGLRPCAEATQLVTAEIGEAGREHQLVPEAAAAWRSMKEAAQADGIRLFIVSAYRSCERQVEIIQRKLASGQTIEEILCVSAPPGYSEHHSGRAVDLGTEGTEPLAEVFEGTAAFRWLEEHASRFGFTLSYPRGNAQGYAYEPWHWCHASEGRR